MAGSIMDMFRSKPAATEPAPGNQQQQQQQQQPGPSVRPVNGEPPLQNPLVPGSEARSDGSGPGAFPAAGEGDKSPLDAFADLWQIDPKAKPAPTLQPLTVDPAKMMAAAGKFNFAATVSPELAAKAMKGDPAAFAEAMNIVGQNVFAQAATVTTNIVNGALDRSNKHWKDTVVPDILRTERVGNAIAEELPIFSNPAAAPLLDMAKTQLMKKYPNASPAEIKKMAGDYLTGFAQELVTGSGKVISDKPATPGSKGGGRVETDWASFLGEDTTQT